MLRSTLTILLALLTTVLFAQKTALSGTIIDTAQQPLSGIVVQLSDTRFQTLTDQYGYFIFNQVPPGNYTVVASGIGYSVKKQNISVASNKTVTLNLQLDIASGTLKEVVVQTRTGKQNTTALTRSNTALRDIPQNIQTVDRNVIKDQQIFYLDEVLKNVAGMTSANYYGGFTSRGFTSSATGVTTNGINGSAYPEGQTPLLGNIERVEVIHGPSAILNGPGALGGNINMVTKQPKKNTTVNASLTGGSFNLVRAQADFTGSLNKKKNLYFLAGSGWQQGGKFTKGFRSRSFQFYGSLKWEISSKTNWQVNTNYVNDDASNNYQPRVPIYNTRNLDSTYLVPYDFNPGADSYYKGNNFQAQSIFEHKVSTSFKLGLLVGYTEARADRAQYYASGFVRLADNMVTRSYAWQQINSPQTALNLYTIFRIATGKIKHNFTLGIDGTFSRNNYPKGLEQYSAKPVSVYNPVYEPRYDSTGQTFYGKTKMEKFTYNNTGAYIMDQVEISERIKVLAGLRFNNYHRRYYAENTNGSVLYNEEPLDASNFSPRLGIVYQPVRTVSIYADYNQGFVPHYGNYTENGGPFDPETSKQYEVGVKGEFFQGRFQPFLTVYQNTKKNVLQAAPTAAQPRLQESIGEVRSRGIEMGAMGNVTDNLYLIINYNYNKTLITKSKKPEDMGQLFANAPQNSANAWLRYTILGGKLKGLFLGGGFQFVDQRYYVNVKTNNLTPLIMPAYTVFDAFVGYRLKQYSLQLNASNLADKRYASSGSTNAYTPGTPRTFMATFSCSFR